MSTLITRFVDGSFLEFGKGAFDDWCVYLTRPYHTRVAPNDREYFASFQKLARAHTARKIYDDFVKIYEVTTREITATALRLIETCAKMYKLDAVEIEILFAIVYAGMVAEENKEKTKLGKRVKRLGMYQVLLENMAADEAATFSKGKKWQEIDGECRKRGF